MSEHDVVKATRNPVTEESLLNDLRAVGVGDGMVLLVHSSLSSLGWVSGGSLAVVRTLIRAVGSGGTLVLPTHSTDFTEPEHWRNPSVPQLWWDIIRDTMPAYDPRLTPTRAMGAIADLFRTYPGVIRSSHPTASFAALGPKADDILAEHPLEDPFGERSPLAKLYDLGASILLLGVGHDSNTTLHLAERRAFGARQPQRQAGAPMMVEGTRRWVRYLEPGVSSDDFHVLGASFERDTEFATIGAVGNAETRLFGVRALVDFGVPWLQRNRT